MSITVRIPGAVYYDALDPLASGVAGEMGLPEPEVKARGYGIQVIYRDVTTDQATDIAEYLHERGELMLGQDLDPSERAVSRSEIVTAAKIKVQVREHRLAGGV